MCVFCEENFDTDIKVN